VATSIGIHTLILKAGVSAKAFETLVSQRVFPVAAETPGSVNRGGQSAIASQHLLASARGTTDYLWLVKSSGIFSDDQFETVLQRMYDEGFLVLEEVCERRSTVGYNQASGYDAGPRDVVGRPTGPPILNPDL
jgi:hypothetical protein